MSYRNYTGLLSFALLLCSLGSCKKYLDVGEPATQLNGNAVFENDNTAIAAQLAIYTAMESEGLAHTLLINTGISSDECTNHRTSVDATGLATNNITPENNIINSIWTSLYKYIYQSNAVLEGVGKSKSISGAVRNQLTGEALFTRAFCHFYLVSLFGNIPVITTTDPVINAIASQKAIAETYAAIQEDLILSKQLLSPQYVAANNTVTTERVRPNKFTAAALLARIYLSTGQWTAAETEADSLINLSSVYSLTTNLNSVFLKNSSETIWQLMAVLPKFNSYTGGFIQPTGTPSLISLTPQLISTFLPADNRKAAWTKNVTVGVQSYTYPYKFKVGQNAASVTEYTMVFRLGEQYLIRAEARARQNKLNEARSDLNAIRNRAGLPNTTAFSQAELLSAIGIERSLELFAEFGDRWLDLKRTGNADLVMPGIKGSSWTTQDQLYPIPQNEIIRNPNLLQNPGY